ncbi:MAG: hypothetical protein EKK34_31275 [Mycobacterium sp.]|nr:MAG: hypothetical protein EKK34_31275 [Mycobacterium sp.]
MSQAFVEWKAICSDIRSYLQFTQTWTVEAHARILEEAKRELADRFDPDSDDPEEYIGDYLNKVGYLWEEDYLWMLRAGALRDVVTAFEVYAEKSALEVLKRWRLTGPDGAAVRMVPFVGRNHTSPSWPTLCLIHDAFGNRLDTDDVKYVRDLRHLLTHQRGELRTTAQREKFVKETGPGKGGPFDPGDIPLDYLRVVQMMDDLASTVQACDRAIWSHTRGNEPPSALIKLTEGKNPALVREL